VSAATFLDSEHLLVGGPEGTVQTCDRTAVPISCQVVATELGPITGVARSHNGRLLAASDDEGLITLQNLDGDGQDYALSAERRVTSLAFSADDQRLIAGLEAPLEAGGASSTDLVKVWDLSALPETPKAIPLPQSGSIMIESLEVKPVGVIRSLAVGGGGERVAIGGSKGITWKTGADRPVTQLGGRAEKTRSLSFSPDGSQLASGRNDGWIYLWDTENDRTQSPPALGRLKAPVIALGWFEAKALIAVDADGLVFEFNLDPEFLKKQACSVAGRDYFSADESMHYFDTPESHRACY
jgi:WD40 repeat protein